MAATRETLRVTFLGSGSAGNATLVSFGRTALLVDAGLSARETGRRMAEAGLDPLPLTAVLLTHSHGDHVGSVRAVCGRSAFPVVASRGTAGSSCRSLPAERVRLVAAGDTFRAGDIEVSVFGTSHDTHEPVGYVFKSPDGCSFGLLTDSGRVTDDAAERLAGCAILGLETNHDVGMLEDGPYPAFLKRRIRSEAGHLSNEQAAEALAGGLAGPGLRLVVGLHLSQQNNDPALADSALRSALSACGRGEVTVRIASQDRPLAVSA